MSWRDEEFPVPTLNVNGADLYHEVRGDGPALLCIMGASGDGGHFDELADLLSDEFTVITYDRRGNGRSPRPAGWATTSPEEQADDAAALLAALGLAPAAVFGTSSGGTFALCLLVRHPGAVRGAILHEAVVARLYDDPEAVAAAGRELVRAGMEAGGPREALKRFFLLVGGQANWDALDPGLRERMLATADTFLGIELGTFEAYLPTDEELAAITKPVQIVVSEHGRAPQHGAARRLAEQLSVAVTRIPGTHTAHLDHPRELADSMRPFLRRVTGGASPHD
jgi:pimeloyl-ACP methyl ester carboxylesterase